MPLSTCSTSTSPTEVACLPPTAHCSSSSSARAARTSPAARRRLCAVTSRGRARCVCSPTIGSSACSRLTPDVCTAAHPTAGTCLARPQQRCDERHPPSLRPPPHLAPVDLHPGQQQRQPHRHQTRQHRHLTRPRRPPRLRQRTAAASRPSSTSSRRALASSRAPSRPSSRPAHHQSLQHHHPNPQHPAQSRTAPPRRCTATHSPHRLHRRLRPSRTRSTCALGVRSRRRLPRRRRASRVRHSAGARSRCRRRACAAGCARAA